MRYQTGFGNEFATEAMPGALPVGMNSPQKTPFGLYPEQLSGSAFTAIGTENQRSWLYRIQPSVVHGRFERWTDGLIDKTPHGEGAPTPERLRWDPMPFPEGPTDFVEGLTTFAVNGDPEAQSGSAIHLYVANRSMKDRCFYSADGDFLIVPQEGALTIRTELGILEVEPQEIAVVQRGVRFAIELTEERARGYVCENYGAHFRLPYRGPIGANGLANPRDFLTPVAAYEEKKGSCEMIGKFLGHLWRAKLDHSPFDVVAWHGNYAPYKYDLRRFNTINTVSFDHPDPSIFTVLTSPSDPNGTANVDFVIFPPRWMVAEKTFRPPYFHRNFMSEYMGLIHGVYDAKPAGGFEPGGGSLHNCMSAHGPEAKAFKAATDADLTPEYLGDTLAFMFESRYVFKPTRFAMSSGILQEDYADCWRDLEAQFKR